ncbi:MAG: hypothetical protein V2B20_24390 [Pseudomonadota bacterium]
MPKSDIQSKGNRIEEAEEKLSSLIPDGYYIINVEVIDEKWSSSKDIMIDAKSIDAARKMIESHVSEGFFISNESIIRQPSSGTIIEKRSIESDAFKYARWSAPRECTIQKEKVLVPSVHEIVMISAIDRETAIKEANNHGIFVENIDVLIHSRKGFLGLGRKNGLYKINMCKQQAEVEISYIVEAKVTYTITPQVTLNATIVNNIEELIEIMDHIATNDSGLSDFISWFGLRSRYYILEAIESIADQRFSVILFKYIKNHFYSSDKRKAIDDVLNTLDKIGGQTIRGEMIEFLFANTKEFVGKNIPDLFGIYTNVLRNFVKAFEPIRSGQQNDWRGSDGVTIHFNYDVDSLLNGINFLCSVNNPVSTNLLHKFASLPETLVPLGYSDIGHMGSADPTTTIQMRKIAKYEIVKRGRPSYNFNAYKIDKYYVS